MKWIHDELKRVSPREDSCNITHFYCCALRRVPSSYWLSPMGIVKELIWQFKVYLAKNNRSTVMCSLIFHSLHISVQSHKSRRLLKHWMEGVQAKSWTSRPSEPRYKHINTLIFTLMGASESLVQLIYMSLDSGSKLEY